MSVGCFHRVLIQPVVEGENKERKPWKTEDKLGVSFSL
jgi:hypothetical protein